jgi:hypothetical protein
MQFMITSSKKYSYLLLALVVFGFATCTPDVKDGSLGELPKAQFTATPIAGRTNTYLLTSTSANTTQWKWDVGDGAGIRSGKQIDTAYYPSMGVYKIKLLAMGKGGLDSAFQTLTIAADDPNGCVGAKAMLTGCSSKTWKLAPEAGALFVGPVDFSQTWWQNGVADVAARSCQFNDKFTFKSNGTFEFNNQGDIWVEDEGGNPWPTDIGGAVGCHPFSAIAPQYQAWGSSTTHTFTIIANSKIKVGGGTGAFLGMYKVGDAGNAAAPESSITYDIMSISNTRLVIKKDLGWGAWKFTFVPE